MFVELTPSEINRQIEENGVPKEARSFGFKESGFVLNQDGEGEKDDSKSEFAFYPYDGRSFRHWYWGKLAFDLQGMTMYKSVIVALWNHNPDSIVGEIYKSDFQSKVSLYGDFIDSEKANEIRQLKRYEMECSLGLDLENGMIEYVDDEMTTTVNGQEFEGPGYIFRKCQVSECSFTPFGAVPGTSSEYSDFQEVQFSKVKNEVKKVSKKKDKIDGGGDTTETQDCPIDTFNKMQEACPSDPAFVNQCFSKKMNFSQFQSALITKLQEENIKSQEDLEKSKKRSEDFSASTETMSSGGDPVTLTSKEDIECTPENIIQLAKNKAKNEGISEDKAMYKIIESSGGYHKYHKQFLVSTRKDDGVFELSNQQGVK